MLNESSMRFRPRWIALSAVLLSLYLGFFHYCLHASYEQCNIAGIVCWLVWSVVCISGRSVFLNRFEFLIHLFVGVDLLLEGFSPLHEGYGFYVCASCFWAVFTIYHSRGAVQNATIIAEADSVDVSLAG